VKNVKEATNPKTGITIILINFATPGAATSLKINLFSGLI